MSERKPGVKFDRAAVDAIFESVDQCHLPGAAVGVALGGRPIYRRGFGLANIELPIVLTPATRMRIYSATKQFACLAFMLLCEDGKADIDAPIGRYFPDFHPTWKRVTARQLMGHNSGLRDILELRWIFSGASRNVSIDEMMSFCHDIDDANCSPRTTWCYNNGAYQILSAAIQRISDESLEDILKKRIFDPIGMNDTLLRQVDSDFVPNSASMHVKGASGQYERNYTPGPAAGNGGIVSTVDDMLRWMAHMDMPHVGSTETWSLMKTPQILLNGVSTGYGLGLIKSRYRGIETLSHSGGGQGANCLMMKVPSAGLDVIVIVNRSDVMSVDLVNGILDSYIPDLVEVKEPVNEIKANGVFLSESGGKVIQLTTAPPNHRRIKEGRAIVSLNGFDIPVRLDDRGVLRPIGSLDSLKLEFELQGDVAQPTAIRLSDFGNLTELVRMPPSGRESDDGEIVGRYRSDATDSEVDIFGDKGGMEFNSTGRFGTSRFKLERLNRGVYRCRSSEGYPWGGVLLFEQYGKGFRFSSLQNWALPFRRLA